MDTSGTILIVDDSPMDRKLVESVFVKKGFVVDLVESGEACLKVLETKSYDIILLDYMMDGISGLETVKAIREQFTSLELPVLMITAKSESRDIVSTLSAGANDYITKPIDIEEAFSRVKIQLTLKSLSREASIAKEMRAINALITTYNHEINNPLAIALGNIDLYKKTGSEKSLESVEKSLRRIADIVKKIADVCRGGIEFEKYTQNSDMVKLDKSK